MVALLPDCYDSINGPDHNLEVSLQDRSATTHERLGQREKGLGLATSLELGKGESRIAGRVTGRRPSEASRGGASFSRVKRSSALFFTSRPVRFSGAMTVGCGTYMCSV